MPSTTTLLSPLRVASHQKKLGEVVAVGHFLLVSIGFQIFFLGSFNLLFGSNLLMVLLATKGWKLNQYPIVSSAIRIPEHSTLHFARFGVY